ncbi:hypothetical protein DFH07DRAFT_1062626 [Mycena maculata]|uniref:Protein kinase domain-containing protein n=1 Tax=Mycena maculata TaxID=230809 RepID=A0AAD7ISB2_9AGAR|nr:hypothetical protein DFH07DRAFT_1062626 [Mycena maculata]
MSQDEMLPPFHTRNSPPRPSSNKRKTIKESPRKRHLATTEDYQSGNLEKRRDAVLADIGYVPKVSVPFFFGSVFPDVPPTRVKDVDGRLKKGHHLVKADNEFHWAAFPKNPSQMSEHEDLAFSPLDKIWEAIVRMGQNSLSRAPTLALEQNPNRTPVSDRSENTRPDGQCAMTDAAIMTVLADLGMSYSSYSNVVPWEFKKKDTEYDAVDNLRKVVWTCHNTLLIDPRRRFIFGITIEDTQTTVWYFSRTAIMATERFDFVKKPSFIWSWLSRLLSLRNSALTLPFPYTEILPNQSKVIQFKMEVGGTVYVTCGPLYDYSADAIRGRGMRVWKVYKDGAPDVFFVIKDVWILRDSVSEGAQLRRLYEHLEHVQPSPDGRKPTDYFLSLVADEFVKLSDGTEDDTHLVMMRNQEIPNEAGYMRLGFTRHATRSRPSQPSHPSQIRGSKTLTMRPHASGLPPLDLPSVKSPVRHDYLPRKHYRIVFENVGTTVYNLQSLSDVMNAVADAVEGLNILHSLKLVHRDITPANILVINGIGKLSDLEYSKSVDRDGPAVDIEISNAIPKDSEHKTGTKAYIAIEVERDKYLFTTRLYTPAGTDEVVKLEPPPDFCFNPIHDLESIFWIVLWVLTHYRVEITRHDGQSKLAANFFDLTSPSCNLSRFEALSYDQFQPTQFPGPFSHAVKSLLQVRSALLEAYRKFETGYALHLSTGNDSHFPVEFDGLHRTFVELFRQTAEDSSGIIFFVETDDEDGESNGGVLGDETSDSDSSIEAPPTKRSKAATGRVPAKRIVKLHTS